jgi:hypothetical protein
MMRPSFSQPAILWGQVLGLATVQGAISLMWVIYNLYLPQLLSQFGFPKPWVIGLLVVENLLGVVAEPLMGGLSDRSQRWLSSKFPFVAVGVVLTSALFISIPAIAIFGSPVSGLRWVLPAALVAWALAMTTFRSPVLSLLGRYAFATKLPQAASALTLMGALIGSLGAFANQMILGLGPTVAFSAGSLVLLAAAAILWSMNPQAKVANPEAEPLVERTSFLKLALIFVTGSGVGLGFTLVMRSLLNPAVPQADPNPMLGLFTIVHILTVMPAGLLAVRIGNKQSLLLGLGAIALALLLLIPTYGTPIALGLGALLGAAWSLIANGTIPFALSMVPTPKAGVGTGLFFGGFSLAISLFGTAVSQVGKIVPALGSAIAIVAFIIAALSVFTSLKLFPR